MTTSCSAGTKILAPRTELSHADARRSQYLHDFLTQRVRTTVELRIKLFVAPLLLAIVVYFIFSLQRFNLSTP